MLTCESCGAENEGRICGKCEKESPSDAVYCAYCGIKLDQSGVPAPKKQPKAGDPYDLDNRVNCGDDMCIGVINEKGVCSECGRTLEETREAS